MCSVKNEFHCCPVEVEENKADESLRYYQESFESPFLAETGHYYRLAASGMVTELSCSDYIRQVVSQLQTARRAGMRFLHPTSLTKVSVAREVAMQTREETLIPI